MHQFRRGKASEYSSIRLREEAEKVKRYYGVFERPVPQVLRAGQPPARQHRRRPDGRFLEGRRLDNIVTRLGFATSRAQEARQMITSTAIS